MNPVSNPAKSGKKTKEIEPEEAIHQDSELAEKQDEVAEETRSMEGLDDKEDSVVVKEIQEGKFTGEAQIGTVIEMYPGAKSILEKHFGACASCPAILKETIVFQVSIHNLDLKSVLDELNKISQ